MKKKTVLVALIILALLCSVVLVACDGAEGIKGDKGDAGDSAYEIWLAEGNKGTQTDFINWLKGNSASTYTITFKTNGAGSIDAATVQHGGKVGKPTEPEKEGYIFGGWYTDSNFSSDTPWSFEGFTVTSDMTLYAKWTEPIYYTITFLSEGPGDMPENLKSVYGLDMPEIDVMPVYDGFIFLGYYNSPLTGNGVKYYNSDLTSARKWDIHSDVTLYAHWKLDLEGMGTAVNPYKISSKEDLTFLASLVNTSGHFFDVYFELTCNIDLGGDEWTPIGKAIMNGSSITGMRNFTGNFDGNGYVVSNFKITEDIICAGLFGSNSGSIKNLGVENVQIEIDSGANLPRVASVGALVAYNNSKIENCYATGNLSVKALSTSNSPYVGGLVGFNINGQISDSYSTCNITTKNVYSAGGLVGSNYGIDTKVANCYATGDVNSSGNTAGGLIGINYETVTNCYATGNVTAENYAGGLVGYNDNDPSFDENTAVISNSFATGNVTAIKINSTVDNKSYAGGLVAYNSAKISVCYATGNVTTTSGTVYPNSITSAYAGGLTGNNTGDITECYAAGNIAATSTSSNSDSTATSVYAGGLTGSSTTDLSSNIANGNISATVISGTDNMPYVYANGLYGYNYGEIFMYYGYVEQAFYRKINSLPAETTPSDNSKFGVGVQSLNSKFFYTGSLNWQEDNWNLDDLDFLAGKYPTLR